VGVGAGKSGCGGVESGDGRLGADAAGNRMGGARAARHGNGNSSKPAAGSDYEHAGGNAGGDAEHDPARGEVDGRARRGNVDGRRGAGAICAAGWGAGACGRAGGRKRTAGHENAGRAGAANLHGRLLPGTPGTLPSGAGGDDGGIRRELRARDGIRRAGGAVAGNGGRRQGTRRSGAGPRGQRRDARKTLARGNTRRGQRGETRAESGGSEGHGKDPRPEKHRPWRPRLRPQQFRRSRRTNWCRR